MRIPIRFLSLPTNAYEGRGSGFSVDAGGFQGLSQNMYDGKI
jgi:hypothetical protein